MKKITLLTLLAMCLLGTMARAQSKKDQRTLNTRIADLLAQMPAKDSVQSKSNMDEISAMGATGLVDMITMLSATGQGDNSHLQYAIGGFSSYVTKAGREDWRQMSVAAYCQALGKLNDKENKAFIISQLEMVGKEDAISSLQNYLADLDLCDPAARALVKINSVAANKVLLQALLQAKGACRLSLVEALGDSQYKEATKAISSFTSDTDKNLNKVALYALANIADPSSEMVLATAAEKSGFTYESTNAVSAYLLYAQNLAANGLQVNADKIAKELLQKCHSDTQVHIRTAALKLLADMHKNKSMPFLLEAAEDKNSEYRAAALKFATVYITPVTTAMWVKKLKKSEPVVQFDIIRMLGESHAQEALPAILKALKSKESLVKLAAITAAGEIGQELVLNDLLKIIKKGDPQEVEAVKNALLIMKGNSVVDKVADAIPTMPANAKAALINILAIRAADDELSTVYPLLASTDAQVRKAAFAALKQMVTKENLPQLFTLLNETSQPEEVLAVQEAIIAAIKGVKEKPGQSEIILQQMSNAPANKKMLFYKVLANIGDEKSLIAVSNAFRNGDVQSKKMALDALSSWSEVNVAKELYVISRETNNSEYLNQAVKGYLHSIQQAPYMADQKLLMLRKAMDVAKTTEQKQLILKEVEQAKTFSALIFAGRYLDETAVQQEAAYAVMNIALANKTYYGNIVKELLNKTMQVLKGPDSEYQKEAIRKYLVEMPQGEGFVSVFNNKDLSGWKGLVSDPILRAKMDSKTLSQKQELADEEMQKGWKVSNSELLFTGEGNNLATIKKYGDFEMLVDWKIYDDGNKKGDAGIYLRGSPQVQIWDISRVADGAQVGSGGLYNNQVNQSKPIKVADNALDEWNNFRIIMKGDRVTVYLNGELVTDNVILENYWDRNLPIFLEEQIELQAHGSRVAYRDIYIREIARPAPFKLSAAEKKEGYEILFDGSNMHNWTGNTTEYIIEDGCIAIHPQPGKGNGGNLYTKQEFSDFIFRFEFQLTPGANNGLGIRTPMEGDSAYEGMELQILDNEADMYKNLKEYQYHGSVYGVIPAKRGFLKPTGDWNYEEVIVKGSRVKVVLNGTVIVDGDIAEASKNGTMDGQNHPGLKRDKGHIGFLGHGSAVQFKNIRIKDLSKGK